MFSADFKATIL